MTNMFQPLIICVYRNPVFAETLSLTEWDLLIRQARRAGLLARLGFILKKYGVRVPLQPLNHIDSAQIYADQFNISLEWEIKSINDALKEANIEPVFLKGAAYLIANNQASLGRVFSDIDILVERSMLDIVERAWMLTIKNITVNGCMRFLRCNTIKEELQLTFIIISCHKPFVIVLIVINYWINLFIWVMVGYYRMKIKSYRVLRIYFMRVN